MQQKKYQKLKENGWLVIRIVLGFISSYGTRQKKILRLPALICWCDKNALQRPSLSLAWRLDREIRRRLILHETGFTLERFFTSYFIDVDTFRFWIDLVRVSDDRKYVCCRLYACINTRKFKGLDSREITSLPKIKKVIYMARHFNHSRKYIACSWQDPTA